MQEAVDDSYTAIELVGYAGVDRTSRLYFEVRLPDWITDWTLVPDYWRLITGYWILWVTITLFVRH